MGLSFPPQSLLFAFYSSTLTCCSHIPKPSVITAKHKYWACTALSFCLFTCVFTCHFLFCQADHSEPKKVLQKWVGITTERLGANNIFVCFLHVSTLQVVTPRLTSESVTLVSDVELRWLGQFVYYINTLIWEEQRNYARNKGSVFDYKSYSSWKPYLHGTCICGMISRAEYGGLAFNKQ